MKYTLAIILSLAFAAAQAVRGPNYGEVNVNTGGYSEAYNGPYGEGAYAGSNQNANSVGYSADGERVSTVAYAGTGNGASATKYGVNAGSDGYAGGSSNVGN